MPLGNISAVSMALAWLSSKAIAKPRLFIAVIYCNEGQARCSSGLLETEDHYLSNDTILILLQLQFLS